MSTVEMSPQRVRVDLIDVGENVRPLDEAHVSALAASIRLRGLVVPLPVRPIGRRFRLVAGHHRHAACRQLGLKEVEVTLRDRDGSSADSAAENVMRKQLSPLEEARAVAAMLKEGYTLEGAASALGWSRALVSARVKILDLPELAQELLNGGELPVSAVDALLAIAAVSPELCVAALEPVRRGVIGGGEFARDPGWAVSYALQHDLCETFAARLSSVSHTEIADLRLGKKAQRAYERASELHERSRHAYGPPTIRFAEVEVDQARAAGVLVEFEHGTPAITDRALYRELVKQAIERTVDELEATAQEAETARAIRHREGKRERTPREEAEAVHRAVLRELKERAHGANLDLGARLLHKLAVVDPADMDVARFFAYGLLGPDREHSMGCNEEVAWCIAANGIRLVIEEHRTVTTPTLKSGKPGKRKIAYGEVQDAQRWLWRFIDGAGSAGELYGRTLLAFVAQHYAHDLVLPASQRRRSAVPSSHKDTARKALERLAKTVLPASCTELTRALEREAREHAKRQEKLRHAA